MQAETADRWLEAWVLEATGRGLPKDGRYWQAGWDWIVAERAARRPRVVTEERPERPGGTGPGRSLERRWRLSLGVFSRRLPFGGPPPPK